MVCDVSSCLFEVFLIKTSYEILTISMCFNSRRSAHLTNLNIKHRLHNYTWTPYYPSITFSSVGRFIFPSDDRRHNWINGGIHFHFQFWTLSSASLAALWTENDQPLSRYWVLVVCLVDFYLKPRLHLISNANRPYVVKIDVTSSK
jgi:hypothetical protein